MSRGRVIGWVKSGELVGAAGGFVVTGVLVSLFSWRSAFVALGLIGLVVGATVVRIPEPRRGGEGRTDDGPERLDEPSQLRELIEEEGAEPKPELVLDGDVADMGLPAAIHYVTHVRTLVMIIAAGALGDFFFTAVQVFGVLFLVEQFDISASTAGLLIPAVGVAGFFGVIAGGRFGDWLLERHVVTGRLKVGRVELSGRRRAVHAGAAHDLTRGRAAVPDARRRVPDGTGRPARGGAARRRPSAAARTRRERTDRRACRRAGRGAARVRDPVRPARRRWRGRPARGVPRVPVPPRGQLAAARPRRARIPARGRLGAGVRRRRQRDRVAILRFERFGAGNRSMRTRAASMGAQVACGEQPRGDDDRDRGNRGRRAGRSFGWRGRDWSEA